MIAWVRNEVRVLLGRNPSRGDVFAVTVLATVWLVLGGCILALALGALWALWTGLGWIGMAGLAVFLIAIRTIWVMVSLTADALRTETDK